MTVVGQLVTCRRAGTHGGAREMCALRSPLSGSLASGSCWPSLIGTSRNRLTHQPDSEKSDGARHRHPMAALPRQKRHGNQEVRSGGQGRTDSRSESGQTSEVSLPEGRESAQADSSQSNHRHADFQYDGESPGAPGSRRPGRGFPGPDRTALPDRADSELGRPNPAPNRRRGACGVKGLGSSRTEPRPNPADHRSAQPPTP